MPLHITAMKNIRQFEIILEITRQGSISGAAETLGVSQPTLSKLVHKLEEELGLELFDRRCIPLKLTAAGECCIDAATQIMDVHHRLDKQLERIRTGTST